VDLYFFACDLLTSGFPGGSGGEIVAMLTTGPLALFFWAELLFGVVTMLIAFVPSLRRTGPIVLAAILSVLAILCKRVQLLIGGFQEANITYPTVPTGPELTDAGQMLANVGGSLVYTPSPLELGVVCGVLALGAFLLLLGLRSLPLKPRVP
jgi:molybdopterin-containing oxidoreductase family membrane subunit